MLECGKTFEEFEQLNGISVEEMVSVFGAMMEAYPMIVRANLTKNTYTMIKDDGFLVDDIPMTGRYDDMIDIGVEGIHPNYQSVFLDNFSRERLMQSYAQGKREVSAKLYQKGRGNQYQWVSTHVVRVEDKHGDICQVCINKILGGGFTEECARYSGQPS